MNDKSLDELRSEGIRRVRVVDEREMREKILREVLVDALAATREGKACCTDEMVALLRSIDERLARMEFQQIMAGAPAPAASVPAPASDPNMVVVTPTWTPSIPETRDNLNETRPVATAHEDVDGTVGALRRARKEG
jgi:hypothetical protein